MKDQKLFEYFEISNPRVQSKSQENLEKLYFFMQGVAALLPWSSILCTLDFYSAKYPNDDTSFTFPVAFFVSGVGFNFLMVYIKRRLSLNVRVIGGLLLLLVFLILLPLIAQNLANTTKGLWICLLLLFIIGIANTVSNASVAGLSGHFPAFCRSVHSTGAGIAALITNIIRVFIIIFSDSPNPATDIREIMFFYGAAVLLLIAGIVLHVQFVRSNPTMAQLEQPKENNNETQIQHNFHHQWKVFQETPFWVTAMFISNTQTFMLYPGVLFKKPLDFTDFTWTIIIISAVFNISDTIGKYVSFMAVFLQKKIIMWMVASRFLFFIFFLWPLINPDVALLGQSWFLLLMVAIFGFTNGLILSAVFIMAPEEVQGEKKEIAGFLAFNAMMIGIMSGSFLALIFSSL